MIRRLSRHVNPVHTYQRELHHSLSLSGDSLLLSHDCGLSMAWHVLAAAIQ